MMGNVLKLSVNAIGRQILKFGRKSPRNSEFHRFSPRPRKVPKLFRNCPQYFDV